MLIFGTRPEAIKMAPVIWEFQKDPSVHLLVCVTGQHREMLDQMLKMFGITPNVDLQLMLPNQELFSLTNLALERITMVLRRLKPDLVLVQGDTTTAMAASLAAFYEKIPIGHVEAGLRTQNIYSPFPEEFNRKSIGVVATLHFAPTEFNKKNLLREGVDESRIFVTGNTAVDSLFTIANLEMDSNTKSVLKLIFKTEVILSPPPFSLMPVSLWKLLIIPNIIWSLFLFFMHNCDLQRETPLSPKIIISQNKINCSTLGWGVIFQFQL